MAVVVADAIDDVEERVVMDVEERVVRNVDVAIISNESEESASEFNISDQKSGSDDQLLTSDESDWCSDSETIQVKKQK